MTNISIRNIIFVAGDYKSFIYVHLDLHSGEAKEITWEQADDMLSSPGKPPLKGNLGRFEYIKVVVEDLRIRGYADYLPAYIILMTPPFCLTGRPPIPCQIH